MHSTFKMQGILVIIRIAVAIIKLISFYSRSNCWSC